MQSQRRLSARRRFANTRLATPSSQGSGCSGTSSRRRHATRNTSERTSSATSSAARRCANASTAPACVRYSSSNRTRGSTQGDLMSGTHPGDYNTAQFAHTPTDSSAVDGPGFQSSMPAGPIPGSWSCTLRVWRERAARISRHRCLFPARSRHRQGFNRAASSVDCVHAAQRSSFQSPSRTSVRKVSGWPIAKIVAAACSTVRPGSSA